jgi:hypothetical protein
MSRGNKADTKKRSDFHFIYRVAQKSGMQLEKAAIFEPKKLES